MISSLFTASRKVHTSICIQGCSDKAQYDGGKATDTRIATPSRDTREPAGGLSFRLGWFFRNIGVSPALEHCVFLVPSLA